VLENSQWEGTTLYTSLEPCIMCCGTIHWAGIKTVVYGGTNRMPAGPFFGPDRLRIREIYQRYGWDIAVRGPLMDTEQLKIRSEVAAYAASHKS
jgi:tRNA(Arg) A34 adenosine deaminase TadA